MGSERRDEESDALAATVDVRDASDPSTGPTLRASRAPAGDAADRPTPARFVFYALAALALTNVGHFVLRFVIDDERPTLHPTFEALAEVDSARFGALGAFGGWPTTAGRLIVVALVLVVFPIVLVRRHRGSAMVHLFAALALLGGQLSMAVTVLTSQEPSLAWRLVALSFYALLPCVGFVAVALFPDGRPVPRWSVFLLPVAWFFPVAQGIHMFRTREYSQVLFLGTMLAGLLFLGFSIHRYRRHATLRQRHQIKWLTYAAFTFVTTQMVAVVLVLPWVTRIDHPAQPLFKLLYEVLVGSSYLGGLLILLMAAVRYRLWAIDRLLNRTIVYGLLSFVLGTILFVVYLALRALLYELTDASSSVAAVMAVAIAAGLFPLLRRPIVRWTDRRVFGIRIDYEGMAARAMGKAPTTADTFATYGELELLGRGGMGAVYRATHPEHGAVALKIMDRDLSRDPIALARFRREGEILEGVRHPNVVPFLARGDSEGLSFLAMRFLEGVDLQSILRERGRLSLAEALALLEGIADALDATHALGVIHRDVKPANILVVGPDDEPLLERQAMLMDFGIARWAEVEGEAESEDVIGSLAYIAPEQIRTPDAIDGRADVYALGVTAYQALTGELPFRSQSKLGLLFCHMSQPPPNPRERVPDLPSPAADALLRALAKEPSERFATARELVLALAEAERDVAA